MIVTTIALLGLAAGPGCKHIGSMPVGAELSRTVVRPGERVGVHLYWRDGPFGNKDVPRRCVKKLRVAGPARLAKGGAIEIGTEAKSGDIVTLSMEIGGTPARRAIKITGRDEQVLTGKWRPLASEHCQGRLPAEIVFDDDGRYTFTFPEQMVETMISGGGTYSWDQTSGALTMSWSPGARTARFEGDKLLLEGVEFEMPPPPPPGEPAPPPCRLVLG